MSTTCRANTPEYTGSVEEEKSHRKKRFPQALPASFTATVTEVKDGDTLQVLWQKQPLTIRVADIDCPEFKQPFGIEATELSQALVGRQTVRIKVRATDRYGRTVADVFMQNGKSLGAELLKAGLAWWYHRYSKDKTLEAMEEKARKAGKGLWSQKIPVPPWIYRRQQL